ncbi:MAG: bi-domain-containing oxidoreductase [Calditrichia bacterium]
MKQLVQNLKTGKMELADVPIPYLGSKNILVKVQASLISAGTEGMKVNTARKGYIGKAKEKPEQVKQVLETLQKEGIANTYRKVMNKLDAWSPLGYSCAGEVVKVGADVTKFRIGDLVACAGQDIANHAEYVSVPLSLAAKIPVGVSPEEAAYTTLGAIALQGVRQADLKLGESCVVIGLGLIGQLTVQLLNSAGIDVFGVDINPQMVELAIQSGARLAFHRDDDSLESIIARETAGYGADAVIITAGVNSTDPVELAGRILRKKGKVVVVGAVPTGFSRENYYKKELELRMSCSYGPGRYDPDYEEKGIDYPYGYVRWTENRNMQAFLNLIKQKKINPSLLTTHTFELSEAKKAYELILDRREPFIGILLKYPKKDDIESNIYLSKKFKKENKVSIGFIGAGSFAQTFLLPPLASNKAVHLNGIANSSGHTARTVAERYHFNYATGDYKKICTDPEINTVFIATRHNLHSEQVLLALRNNKNVFVEKPLTISLEELIQIKECYYGMEIKPYLMVGFNRRFSPHSIRVKEMLNGPVAINYRINAGYIPLDHWTQDPEVGGGRILGELCHFVDLCNFFADSTPTHLSAQLMEIENNPWDTLTINMAYRNGSIASIHYFSNGNKKMEKERIEVFNNGCSYIINDFRDVTLMGKSKKVYRTSGQNKGQQEEVNAFICSILNNSEPPINFNDIYISSLIPFKIIESIKERKMIKIEAD